jgi:xylulose-5-phosphate/fructose-6-phosphate phosphoketolase
LLIILQGFDTGGKDGTSRHVLVTKDKPIIFAYPGYSWLIHRLTNHENLPVRGYKEEGTIPRLRSTWWC